MAINITKGKADDGGFILEGNIHITRRELEVLTSIASGNDNKEAAIKLCISYTTLRNHAYNVMKKLGANNRTEALARAIENEMIHISTRRNLVKKYAEDYYVCMSCGRTFLGEEEVQMEIEPFEVNHVRYEPPPWPKCPYDDCNGYASDSYSWKRVRKFHPEYPEIPEKGKKYSIVEVFEEDYKALEDAERQYLEEQNK